MIHFINLTNGLEAIEERGLKDYHFMRLQSTWCEQKRWNDILWTLPDDFLMHAALGAHIQVYDYGCRRECPRALWQGLAWVNYALHRRWFDYTIQLHGRVRSSRAYFEGAYRTLEERTYKRLDYFGQYARRHPLICPVWAMTVHDGKKEYYRELAKRHGGRIRNDYAVTLLTGRAAGPDGACLFLHSGS